MDKNEGETIQYPKNYMRLHHHFHSNATGMLAPLRPVQYVPHCRTYIGVSPSKPRSSERLQLTVQLNLTSPYAVLSSNESKQMITVKKRSEIYMTKIKV